jgi:thiamine-phosphate pyrophosphorylase
MVAARHAVRGLYAVTADTADSDLLYQRVEAILRGGARLLQYRSKNSERRLRLTQARTLLELCRTYTALLIVNDDVSIAQTIGADGVHVGCDDASIAAARASLGPRLIGASCYDSLERAMQAQRAGADYVAFGSFFPSSVKPQAVRAPIDLLRAARARLDVPIVAIGGITPDTAPALIDAGADAVAVVTALFEAADASAAAHAFTRLFESRHKDMNVL